MSANLSQRHKSSKYQSQDEVTRESLARQGLRPTKADEKTWMLGWYSGEDPLGQDRLWRHRIFARYTEEFGAQLAELYAERYYAGGRDAANAWLNERHGAFSTIRFDLALDELRIKRTANEAARAGHALFAPPFGAADVISAALCSRYRVNPPQCRYERGLIARLECPRWWRRNLRRTHGMLFETQARACELVSSRRGPYASNQTVKRRAEQRANTRQLLQLMRATNEAGDELSLEVIAEHTESNPTVRRAALNARLAGFELVAKLEGYVAVFCTITRPSRMHAQLARGRLANTVFDGTTPRQAQRHLCRQFAKARANWARLDIRPFGFRVCEPHQDGTPHWHLLLFVRPDQKDRLVEVLRRYALAVDPDEPGADRHRFRVEEIDPAKGSAVAYLVKYISKHLDGRGLTTDEHGVAIGEAIKRVDAWASTWGIRQFQQIGGPPVGPWRELRRLTSAVDDAAVERARAAADAGDWGSYFLAQGGPAVRPCDMPIHVLRVWSDELGRYGEAKGYITRGVIAGNLAVPTRLHTWTISVDEHSVAARRALITGRPAGVRQGAALGRPGLGGRPDAAQSPQPAGDPVSRPAASFHPWSSVNNCTGSSIHTQLRLPIEEPTLPPAVHAPSNWQPRFWKSRHPRPAGDSVPPLPSDEARAGDASADN